MKVPFSITSWEDPGSKLPKVEREPEEKTFGPLTHCYHLNWSFLWSLLETFRFLDDFKKASTLLSSWELDAEHALCHSESCHSVGTTLLRMGQFLVYGKLQLLRKAALVPLHLVFWGSLLVGFKPSASLQLNRSKSSREGRGRFVGLRSLQPADGTLQPSSWTC